MQHPNQPILEQARPTSQPTVAPMRTLSTKEMRAVGGGPIIENGSEIVAQSASNSKG